MLLVGFLSLTVLPQFLLPTPRTPENHFPVKLFLVPSEGPIVLLSVFP